MDTSLEDEFTDLIDSAIAAYEKPAADEKGASSRLTDPEDNESDFVEVKSRKRKIKDVEMKSTVNKIEKLKNQVAKVPKELLGETRRIRVPANRCSPLRENWMKIYSAVVENLKLQIRYNPSSKIIEIRNCTETEDLNALQKGEDFIRAFTLGFDVTDAIALLRLNDLFLQSFDITEVKPLKGDHLSRAIGRIAGKGGKTKFAIENATRTRIVLADSKVHLLGSFENIIKARNSICDLILGSPCNSVYGKLRKIKDMGL